VTNTEDVHNIVSQANPEAQPERTSHLAVKQRDLPSTRARKIENAFEDAHSCGLI